MTQAFGNGFDIDTCLDEQSCVRVSQAVEAEHW
jgi:hypothetical protein